MDLFVEPLSKRERVILEHLARARSYGEIAEAEVLAINTVKWYVQQIYGKLGVNKRRAALARARILGILPPEGHPPRPTHNLLEQLTSFIGREDEITDIHDLLNHYRLVTLTGSGGIGKTRLAQQVADRRLDVYPDGVWQVDMVPVTDPKMVHQAVMAALKLTEQPGQTPSAALIDALRDKQMLLLLDNCEHLVEACAVLAGMLVKHAARLTVLATSREILGVEGEIFYRVPPLALPEKYARSTLEELARVEAVRLFIDRARLASKEFRLTQDKAADVLHILMALEGIPLAIELAAARLRVLNPRQIAARLDQSFALLKGSSRVLLPRHQTLEAMISWSFDLLSEPEQALLCLLSVFQGGWTVEAAEKIGENLAVPGEGILDILSRLVEKSLILAIPTPSGELRYRMLETVRQFAASRLEDRGKLAETRARHTHYYLALAERLEDEVHGRNQIAILDFWENELGNVRQALEYAIQNEVEAGLRLATALTGFWHIRCHWSEGIAWLTKAIQAEEASPGVQPPAPKRQRLRAKALGTLGGHLLMRDTPDPTHAKPYLEAALALMLKHPPESQRDLAWILVWNAMVAQAEGDSGQAVQFVEAAQAIFRMEQNLHGQAMCLQILGNCEADPLRQAERYRQQLALEEESGDSEGIATALHHLGATTFVTGEYAEAVEVFNTARDTYHQVGNLHMAARNGLFLAILSHLSGNTEKAAHYVEDALAEYRITGNELQIAFCLFWKCQLAISTGRYEQVLPLLAEADRIAHRLDSAMLLTDVIYYRARLARLRGELPKARRLLEQGLALGRARDFASILNLLELAHLELQDGRLDQARDWVVEGFQPLLRWPQSPWTGYFIDGLAAHAVRSGALETAARLFGTRFWQGAYHTFSPSERAARDAELELLRKALGEMEFSRLQGEGQQLTFVQVARYFDG